MAKLKRINFFFIKKDAEFGLDQSVSGNTRFVLSDGTFNVKKISRDVSTGLIMKQVFYSDL